MAQPPEGIDVDMKDKEKHEQENQADTVEEGDTAKKDAPKTPSELALLLLADVRSSLLLLEKGVLAKEQRLISRAVRYMNGIRRRMSIPVMRRTVEQHFPAHSTEGAHLLSVIPVEEGTMDTSTSGIPTSSPVQLPEMENSPQSDPIPEVEIYISILVLMHLTDLKRKNEAAALAKLVVQRVMSMNRRTLDTLAAKVFYFYSLCLERIGKLALIRGELLSAHRTACLRHDDVGQATLLNLLLRNYIEYNLYDQADKLVSKTTFPQRATNNQTARYLYYLGRIRSVQLDYTEAYNCLMQAIRKAPQHSASGFKQAVNKLAVIVQLLMGEIPERTLFVQPELRGALRPYLKLTQAVRVGDLVAFRAVTEEYAGAFRRDRTHTLIVRLRFNVIKTGLRKINVSYSRISLQDIAAKLHLDSTDDAAGIVAKAIRDGVIDATIVHDGGFVQSKETIDIYSTEEPQHALHKRITFCLDVHNEAVKAMRFPPDAHKKELGGVTTHRKQEEVAQDLLEEEEEEDF